MKILIPSLQRPLIQQQKTATALQAAGVPFTIVRAAHDTTDYPTGFDQWTTPARGIAATRQAILDEFGSHGKICIIDDDMVFRVPVGDDGKTREAEPSDVATMFDYMGELLDGFAQVGVADRFRIMDKKKPYETTKKVINITAFNTALWPKDNWPRYRTEIFEDLDITLQLFDRGLDNAVITRFCWSTVRNAKGGCNVWRNDEVLTQANAHLVSLWPGIVRSINGVTRVAVQWRKCLKQGLVKRGIEDFGEKIEEDDDE